MLTQPGTYALIFACNTQTTVQIGALGTLHLKPGWLAYIGSAFGPGGLRSRFRHHLHSQAAPHWHLDYLRHYLQPREAWFTCASQPCEHAWAMAYLELPNVTIPLLHFGASDCACPSHLFHFPQKPPYTEFQSLVNLVNPHHPVPERIEICKNSLH